jgi:CRP-like cAMP-binding protein
VKEGDYSWEFMAIEEGEAEVKRGDEHVADLGPGDVLGEMGVLADAPRNADVVTTSPVRAAVLTAHEMRAIALAVPELGARLRAMASQRSA